MACAPHKSTTNELLFIYGTLKTGYPNASSMPSSARYIGDATTTQRLPLVVGTEMNIPFVLNDSTDARASRVHGEVYVADAAAREALDEFEGVSTGFYDRERVEVEIGRVVARQVSDISLRIGDIVQCWTYVRSARDGGPIWARVWTRDKLRELDMLAVYTLREARRYRARQERE